MNLIAAPNLVPVRASRLIYSIRKINDCILLTLIVSHWNKLHVLAALRSSLEHHHLAVVLTLHWILVELLNLIHALWIHVHLLLLLLWHHPRTATLAAPLTWRHLPRPLVHWHKRLLLLGNLLPGCLRIHFIDWNVLVTALIDIKTAL